MPCHAMYTEQRERERELCCIRTEGCLRGSHRTSDTELCTTHSPQSPHHVTSGDISAGVRGPAVAIYSTSIQPWLGPKGVATAAVSIGGQQENDASQPASQPASGEPRRRGC